ncbi:hypothetical protein CRUP_031985 [Coryphaenoides rupestris]|nr:hypothetical protein CRUP_031985 [Coryphaenoides rupestris]
MPGPKGRVQTKPPSRPVRTRTSPELWPESSPQAFISQGTTPDQSPSQSPCSSPAPSPPTPTKSLSSGKATTSAAKENNVPTVGNIAAAKALPPPPPASQESRLKEVLPPAKPAVATSTANSNPSSNGQIHSQYHGYYVKADVKKPPPDDHQLDLEDNFHPSSLPHLSTPATQRTPASKQAPVLALAPALPAPASAVVVASKEIQPKAPEPPRLKKQDSHKPKSLAETKKASLEITADLIEEESRDSFKQVTLGPPPISSFHSRQPKQLLDQQACNEQFLWYNRRTSRGPGRGQPRRNWRTPTRRRNELETEIRLINQRVIQGQVEELQKDLQEQALKADDSAMLKKKKQEYMDKLRELNDELLKKSVYMSLSMTWSPSITPARG